MFVMKPCALIAILLSGTACAQYGAPAAGDAGDFEPTQMLDTPHASVVSPTPALSPDERLAQCQDALAHAQKRAAEAEGLYKDGILARVEVEGRFMQVVKAGKELADATVIVAAARAETAKKAFDAHHGSQADLDAANAILKSAQAAAASASAAWDKSQLDAATLDLQRKRKLYSEGVCSQRELQMAEDRMILLSGTLPK
jgi:hypothetical protein